MANEAIKLHNPAGNDQPTGMTQYLNNPCCAHIIVTLGMISQGLGAMDQVHESWPWLNNIELTTVLFTATIGKEMVMYGFYYQNHVPWCNGKTAWLSITKHPFMCLPSWPQRLVNFFTSLAFSNACLYFMIISINSALLGGNSPIKAYGFSILALLSWSASLHMNAHAYNHLFRDGLKHIYSGFPSVDIIKNQGFNAWFELYFFIQLIEKLAYDIAIASLRGKNHPNESSFKYLTEIKNKYTLIKHLKTQFGINLKYEKFIIICRTAAMILVFSIISASMISFLTFPRAITQSIITWRHILIKHSPSFAQMIYYPALAVQFPLDPGGVIYCASHQKNTTCLPGTEKIENFLTLDNTLDKSILTKVISTTVVAVGMCYVLALNCSNFLFKHHKNWADDTASRHYLVHKPVTLYLTYIPAALIVLLGASANYLQTKAVLGTGVTSIILAITALLGPALMELEPMIEAICAFLYNLMIKITNRRDRHNQTASGTRSALLDPREPGTSSLLRILKSAKFLLQTDEHINDHADNSNPRRLQG